MKRLFYFLALICFISCSDGLDVYEMDEISNSLSTRASVSNELYYYYKGEKHPLKTNTSAYYTIDVCLDGNTEPDYMITTDSDMPVSNIAPMQDTERPITYSFEYHPVAARTTMDISEYSNYINNIIKTTGTMVSPCLLTDEGKEFYVAPEFYVKLKNAADTVLLRETAEQYNVTIGEKNEYMPLWYTVYCTLKSGKNSLNISNIFYETGLFAATSPGFAGCLTCNSTEDTYFYTQWGLNNTGLYGGENTMGIDINWNNVLKIANGTRIKVGVIDTGIDYSHPDINNASISYDSYNNKEYSSQAIVFDKNAHGTCCAGIIAAISDNSIGVSGVAPLCEVVSLSNSFEYNVTPIKLANCFSWAKEKGLDVINCSWQSIESDILTEAINDIATNGRNGLGSVVIAAAGNSNLKTVSYPASLENVICVGAIDMYGKRKSPTSLSGETNWGSCYGSGLDVVAPGVLITTTDITGSEGYNSGNTTIINNNYVSTDFSDNNYTKGFNGTSSATPFVSGLAALILSKNIALKSKEVAAIIEKSCTKLPSYSFQSLSTKQNGTWNQEVGYGLINVLDAVLNSQVYPNEMEIKGNNYVTKSGTNYIVNGLPSATSIKWSISSNKFTLTQNGYNSVLVKSNESSGTSAILYAEIVLGTETLKKLSKIIYSE